MIPECKTCRWWVQIGQTTEGHCRWSGPVLGLGGRATWPRTEAAEGCGAHEPIQPTNAPEQG